MAKEARKPAKKGTGKTVNKEAPVMPERIFAQVSPRSIGGVSLFDAIGSVNADTVANFQSEPSVVEGAISRLREAGFEILQTSAITINIAGSQEMYEKAFGTKLVIEQREVIKPGAVTDLAEFIECPDTPIPGLIATMGTPFEDVIEGVAIEEPCYPMAASMFPPSVPHRCPIGTWTFPGTCPSESTPIRFIAQGLREAGFV